MAAVVTGINWSVTRLGTTRAKAITTYLVASIVGYGVSAILLWTLLAESIGKYLGHGALIVFVPINAVVSLVVIWVGVRMRIRVWRVSP